MLALSYSGPSHCCSAGTMHQHLLDLTVDPTASSESSALVFPLCTLHGVLLTASFTVFCSLRSRRSPCLSTDFCTPRIVGQVVVADSTGVIMLFDSVSFRKFPSCFLRPLHHVCVSAIWRCISAGTFMSVYCCFETSTVFGTFWLFLSVPLVAVWTFWLSRASSLGCLLHSVTDRTALDVLPQFSGSRHSICPFCHTFCNRCLFPEFLNCKRS